MSIVAAVDWRETPTASSCAGEIEGVEEASEFIRHIMARLHGEHGEHERRPVKKPRHR